MGTACSGDLGFRLQIMFKPRKGLEICTWKFKPRKKGWNLGGRGRERERATLQELKSFRWSKKGIKIKLLPEHGLMIIIIMLWCKIRFRKNSQYNINCIAYIPQFSFATLALYYIQYRADKIVICIAYFRVKLEVQDCDVYPKLQESRLRRWGLFWKASLKHLQISQLPICTVLCARPSLFDSIDTPRCRILSLPCRCRCLCRRVFSCTGDMNSENLKWDIREHPRQLRQEIA